jgi:hypothetical protein
MGKEVGTRLWLSSGVSLLMDGRLFGVIIQTRMLLLLRAYVDVEDGSLQGK